MTNAKRYIVENTMGDGKLQVKIKYVRENYMFGIRMGTDTSYDPVIFDDKDIAANYAKCLAGPSVYALNKIGGAEYTDYRYGSLYRSHGFTCNVNEPGYMNSRDAEFPLDHKKKMLIERKIVEVFDVNTIYNEQIYKINDSMEKMGLLKSFTDCHEIKYWFFPVFIIYKETYEFNDKLSTDDKCAFAIAKMEKTNNQNIYYCSIKDITLYDDFQDAYDMFEKKTSEQISKALDDEKKKRLSLTVINSTETCVEYPNTPSGKSIKIELTESDMARNELIKKELQRTSEYANMLKSLLK